MFDVTHLSLDPELVGAHYWDHGLVRHILRRFPHNYQDASSLEGTSGRVVILPARNQAAQIKQINIQLRPLEWVVLILTGDEESVFPFERLDHPNMRVWVMSPQKGRHDSAFGMGSGFRREQPGILKDLGLQERDLDWFFAGQITNPHRIACAEQLRKLPGGVLVETEGFAQGLDQRSYLQHLARAKVVPCPSGPVSPDTFRLYEALEAGCIPVPDNGDWWKYVFGTVPFPTVTDWAEFPALLASILPSWKSLANEVFAWWQLQKRTMAHRLRDDIAAVSGTVPEMVTEPTTTTLVATSPIPSHPDTAIPMETIESVVDRLPDSEMIVMFDGVRREQSDRKSAYEEYVRRMLWITNFELDHAVPLYSATHLHQGNLTKRALEMVETPLILFMEHDTPLYRDIPFAQIQQLLIDDQMDVIRFSHENQIIDEHRHLMIDRAPIVVNDVPLIRTSQWSQRPHLARTSYYRHLLNQAVGSRAKTMIEDVVYAVVYCNWVDHGWGAHRVAIYAPEGGLARSSNLDGRGDDKKFDMVFAYDGEVPPGAPAPT